MKRHIRGGGFRYNLPAVFWFSAVWVVLVVLMAPVVTIAMVLGGLVPPELQGEVWFFLLTRVPIIALVAIGIAIFTTNRLAGPWVYVSRSFKKVEHGDLDYRMRFRRCDKHLREVETAFNAMMVALSERGRSAKGPHGVDSVGSVDMPQGRGTRHSNGGA